MTTKAQQQAAKTTTPDPTPDDDPKDTGQVHDGELLDKGQHDAADTPETKAEKLDRLRREMAELDPDAPELNATADRDVQVDQAKAGTPETREERRVRLRNELAKVDEEARMHGGYLAVPTHIGVLLCGDQVQCTNAAATEHHCDEHDAVVPFIAFHAIPESLREKLAAG